MSATSGWYRQESGAVEFLRREGTRFWDVEVLREQPLEPFDAGGDVLLSGAGAVWMYAHAAALAAAGGVGRLRSAQPQAGETTLLPLPDAPDAGHLGCEVEEDDADGLILRFASLGPEHRWAAEGLAALRDRLAARRPVRVCITGPGATWMYAAAAAYSVLAGARQISCFIPREDARHAIVVYSARGEAAAPGQRVPVAATLGRPGVLVGVVGDPNSGKSVLSHLLNHARAQAGIVGWLFDCDAASPTPGWYLAMKGDPALDPVAQALREDQKLRWTHAMEDKVAAQLRNLREVFPLTLADLPGGNHKHDPPLRLPPHREVIFQPIDHLIVLTKDRDDGLDVEQAWRDALRPQGLDARIRAVLRSEAHTAPLDGHLALAHDGCWRGTLRGLRREARSPLPAALGAQLRALLAALASSAAAG